MRGVGVVVVSCAQVTISAAGKWSCDDNCAADTHTFGYDTKALCDTGCQVACTSIAVDTWKPASQTVASGSAVKFTLRSKDPNKYFELREASTIGKTIVTGTTDANGCYSGEIPAQSDGDHTYEICYAVLGVCTAQVSPVTITWGKPGMSWQQTIVYVGAAVAGVYLLGVLLKR